LETESPESRPRIERNRDRLTRRDTRVPRVNGRAKRGGGEQGNHRFHEYRCQKRQFAKHSYRAAPNHAPNTHSGREEGEGKLRQRLKSPRSALPLPLFRSGTQHSTHPAGIIIHGRSPILANPPFILGRGRGRVGSIRHPPRHLASAVVCPRKKNH